MVHFVYLYKEDDNIPETGQAVKAGSNDTIFVPFECLPISVGFWENLFPDVLIDAECYDCVIISISDLYEKLIESGNHSNMELAQSILEHSKYDGWEEGCAWNINTPKFEHFPKPFEKLHCWVHHIQSWKPTCKDCFKPNCPSVEILSHEISLPSLEKTYCDCQKCDECGFIYDNECKCQPSRQKSSDASSDSCLVSCEHCGRKYDAFDETSIYMHNGRCC